MSFKNFFKVFKKYFFFYGEKKNTREHTMVLKFFRLNLLFIVVIRKILVKAPLCRVLLLFFSYYCLRYRIARFYLTKNRANCQSRIFKDIKVKIELKIDLA